MKQRAAYFFVAIGVTLMAVALLGSYNALAEEPDVVLPIRCNAEGLCVVQAKVLKDLMEAHNEQVMEIRRLEALTKKCPVKTEKNA